MGPRGSAILDGREMSKMSAHERTHTVGTMMQDGGAAARLTMLETVLLGRLHALTLRVPPREIERARTVLGRLGIEALAGRMLTELSGAW